MTHENVIIVENLQPFFFHSSFNNDIVPSIFQSSTKDMKVSSTFCVATILNFIAYSPILLIPSAATAQATNSSIDDGVVTEAVVIDAGGHIDIQKVEQVTEEEIEEEIEDEYYDDDGNDDYFDDDDDDDDYDFVNDSTAEAAYYDDDEEGDQDYYDDDDFDADE